MRAARVGGRGPRLAGWNRHVSVAHRDARRNFLDWVACGRPKSGIMYDGMYESKRVFKSRLKWYQDHQEQIKMDALAQQHAKGNFRGFWQNTRKVNIRPGVPVSVDGVTDHKGIADLFKNHFMVKSSPGRAGATSDGTKILRGTVGIRFNAKDLAKIIMSMTKGKSPGHDNLSIEHLQHAGTHIFRVLAMFFTLCVSHSYLPLDFMKTVVVPIAKNKTGDLLNKNNYRPISLATIVTKVFDGMINTQLNKYIKLHDNQLEFRPGLSTESAILCLKHTVGYYAKRGTPVYACFLDLSKAFDLVAYDVLW
jgi:hypothetical protein